MRIRLNLRFKLLFSVLAVVLVGNVINTFVQIKGMEKINSKYANEMAYRVGEEYAPEIYKSIDGNLKLTKVLSSECNEILNGDKNQIVERVKASLLKAAEANPTITSVWASIELRFVDPSYMKDHGRIRITYYRENNGLRFQQDSLELDKDNVTGVYYKSKKTKLDLITDPYWFSYNKKDSILETSIATPMVKSDVFRGLVGFDISLDSFQKMIEGIKPAKGAESFIISADGSIIASTQPSYRGKKILDIYPEAGSVNIIDNITKGETSIFEYKDKNKSNCHFSIFSVKFPSTQSSWGIGFSLPLDELLGSTKDAMARIWYLAALTLLLIIVVISYISHKITRPLQKVNKTLKKLAAGEIAASDHLSINSNDEVEDIAISTNQLIDSLDNTVSFAKNVGKGNLNIEFKPQGENDILGIALLDMKKNLEEAKHQEELRRIEDEKINWATKGTALFGELLRHNNDNLEEFSYHVLSHLIEYIKADVGGLFLLNEQENGETTIDLMASYAYDRRKYEEKRLMIGEGLVGRCVQENETIFLTEIPEGYITIGSGLGENDPTCILIVPLKLNEQVFGVIELASFEVMEDYVVSFVEKIGVTIASTISSTRVNIKTKQLLEASKYQAEELASQEEEMRQNMEELLATQEEASRKNQQIENLVNSLNAATYVMEYDLDGNVLTINDSMLDLLKMHREAIIGMNIKDLDQYAAQHYDEFWNDLRRAISVKAKTNYIGTKQQIPLYEIFIPITDEYSKVYKIMVILHDLDAFTVSSKVTAQTANN